MCLIALFYRALDAAPLIVGANREEEHARGGEPPRLLEGDCRAVAGIDPVAGGTWFGVNERGVLIAVTNRPQSQPPPRPRSRGLLARELLGSPDAAAAVRQACAALGEKRYAGCNLLCADAASATVIHAGDWLRVRPLPPGIHVLTSHDVDDASDRRLGHAHWWLHQRGYDRPEECVAALQELCGQCGGPDPPICLRGADRGTVSSTIACLRQRLAESTYLHAQGPPDRTPYTDYSSLLHEMAATQRRRRPSTS